MKKISKKWIFRKKKRRKYFNVETESKKTKWEVAWVRRKTSVSQVAFLRNKMTSLPWNQNSASVLQCWGPTVGECYSATVLQCCNSKVLLREVLWFNSNTEGFASMHVLPLLYISYRTINKNGKIQVITPYWLSWFEDQLDFEILVEIFLGLSGLTLQLESGLGPFLYFILNKGQASLGFHCITTTDTHNGIIP